ncbi:hypothetical protein EST38_g13086 [Candolleomyces aberdarensis]|uniref:Uncharacterized protein n=2 Tax=Candolleomyces TaxID=2791032 RepID=A0A4V1Q1U1_9AGAR|nr:hypothetical protein EST38_g13086 [Candolleomyces aberdarensis]
MPPNPRPDPNPGPVPVPGLDIVDIEVYDPECNDSPDAFADDEAVDDVDADEDAEGSSLGLFKLPLVLPSPLAPSSNRSICPADPGDGGIVPPVELVAVLPSPLENEERCWKLCCLESGWCC